MMRRTLPTSRWERFIYTPWTLSKPVIPQYTPRAIKYTDGSNEGLSVEIIARDEVDQRVDVIWLGRD